jgi:hypothetical protein
MMARKLEIQKPFSSKKEQESFLANFGTSSALKDILWQANTMLEHERMDKETVH